MADSHDPQATEPLVLLVHKDPDVVSSVTQLLTAEGYSVHHVGTARQAQQHLESLHDTGQDAPDLTLLDDLEHVGDVLAFLHLLEAKANTPPRVILFSELPRNEFADLPRKIRAVGIVVHPYDIKDLIRIVQATIGSGSQSDATRELKNNPDPTTLNLERA